MKPIDPRLLRYSRSSRGFIFLLALLGALNAVLVIAQAYVLVNLICKFFQKHTSFHSAQSEVWLLLAIFGLRALLSFFNDRWSARASSKMRNELRSEVMRKVLSNDGINSKTLGTSGLAVLVTKGINDLDGYFSKFLPQPELTGAENIVMYGTLLGRTQVLLQHRAPWVHNGDTWGIPGGAKDSHESVLEGATREAREEIGIYPSTFTPITIHTDDHGDWRYDTIIAQAHHDLFAHELNDEAQEVAWVDISEVHTKHLHPSFARHWPTLQSLIFEHKLA